MSIESLEPQLVGLFKLLVAWDIEAEIVPPDVASLDALRHCVAMQDYYDFADLEFGLVPETLERQAIEQALDDWLKAGRPAPEEPHDVQQRSGPDSV